MELKQCGACGREKAKGGFYRDRTTTDGLQRWCIECCAERNRVAMVRHWAIVLPALVEGCQDCGLAGPEHITVMQFDHARGEKAVSVGQMVGRSSTARLLDEMAKCDVVCANCHLRRTMQRADHPRLRMAAALQAGRSPAEAAELAFA